MALIASIECQKNTRVKAVLDGLSAGENPIGSVHYVDVRQSMQNGGGPACLRLRVVLTQEELARVHQKVLLTEALYRALNTWVDRFYRDRLEPGDLADPALLEENRAALDALTEILGLGSIYGFQQV